MLRPADARACVICMTEPRDTTVLPCRHMCMCSECAKVLRLQSNKCPICRTSIESLPSAARRRDTSRRGLVSRLALGDTRIRHFC